MDLEDINDNAPRFFPSHCAVAVFDNTTVKTPIAVVFARDPDAGMSECGPWSKLCSNLDRYFQLVKKKYDQKRLWL